MSVVARGQADDRAAAGAARPPSRADLSAAIEGARAGHDADFATIYRDIHPGLLRYLWTLVGDECEDVASEAWAHVCRDLRRFTGDSNGFRAWVATIGRNRALDQLRAKSRRPADVVPPEQLRDRPSAHDTEALAAEALSTAAAVSLISSLPADQAEAVMLRAVMGLDAKAAGQVLGKRPGAVRTASYRGLKTLSAHLQPARANGPRP
jgi:RNA polymerase sigma-70 factor (ECF subfamily)